MEEKKADQTKLKEQIEYYFSDGNLEKDSFFHNAITSDAEGYVPLTLLLKCNRVVQMAADIESLRAAIATSTLVELSDDGQRLRRKGGAAPPSLQSQKVAILWEGEAAPEGATPFRPRLYAFAVKGGTLGNAQDMRRALSRALGFRVPFVLAARQTGQMVCEAQSAEEVEKRMGEPFRAGRWRLTLTALEGEEGKEWVAKHREEVEAVLGSAKHKAEGLQGPVRVGGRLFARLEQLRDYLKLVINRTRDGDQIDGEALAVVLEVVAHHEDPQRSKDVVGIVVDRHPSFNASRCFFVVRADGSRQDFSFHKCLGRLPLATE